MFFWLGYEHLFHFFSPFRIFSFSTFRTAMASITAFLILLVLGPWFIERMRQFQIAQYIRQDCPQTHLKKEGTPTKGGW